MRSDFQVPSEASSRDNSHPPEDPYLVQFEWLETALKPRGRIFIPLRGAVVIWGARGMH